MLVEIEELLREGSSVNPSKVDGKTSGACRPGRVIRKACATRSGSATCARALEVITQPGDFERSTGSLPIEKDVGTNGLISDKALLGSAPRVMLT
jgi:hypothetical protein